MSYGWANGADPSIRWDQWFNVASGGGTTGYCWTPHLKTEFDISTSSEGERYSVEPIVLPGSTIVLLPQRDHEFRVTTASAGVVGQFFDNAWFHPFVGAGVELIREREHIETSLQFVPPRDHSGSTDPGVSARDPGAISGASLCSRWVQGVGVRSVRSSEPTFGRRGHLMASTRWRGAAASASTFEKGDR